MRYIIKLFSIDGRDYYRGKHLDRTSLLEHAKRHRTERGAKSVVAKLKLAYPSIEIVEVDE